MRVRIPNTGSPGSSMSSKARRLFALLVIVGLGLTAYTAAQTKEPHPGQAPYDKNCKVCHGPEGEGNAGPTLVPFEMEFEELLIKVREGGGEMPPFSESRVSDDDVKLIAAYLKSLTPEEKPAK